MRLVVDKFKVITDKKLKKPLRVVFISDTHFGEHPLTAGKWNGNSTLKGLRKLGKIDLILFGGDYVNSALVFKMRYPLKNFTDFLKACAEIAPVIMIRGNHDLYLNNRATEEIYQKFGSIENVTLLDNAQMKFKGIEITGFTPRHSSYDLIKHGKRSHKITMEDFGGAKFKFKKEDFNLIVTHSPYSLTNKRALREFPEVFEMRLSDSFDKKDEEPVMPCKQPEVTEVRPQVLECDVVRFHNNKEKWVAFVGLLNGYPYEIFTGLQDDDEGIVLPKTVVKGKIIKQTDENGKRRYDFQFENKRGYKTTVEGLSEKFNPEYWNYAKLISGVLRYRMPIDHVIKLVGSLQLKSESINTWKNGVERALKKYILDGTEAKGQECPNCGGKLIYQEGCLICKSCGASRCG